MTGFGFGTKSRSALGSGELPPSVLMPTEAFTWATTDGTSTFAVGETFESARSMCASTAYESSIDKNVTNEG